MHQLFDLEPQICSGNTGGERRDSRGSDMPQHKRAGSQHTPNF